MLELPELFGFLPFALLLLWLRWDEKLQCCVGKVGCRGTRKQAMAAAQKVKVRWWNWGKIEISICFIRGYVTQTDPPLTLSFFSPKDPVLHPFLLPPLSLL